MRVVFREQGAGHVGAAHAELCYDEGQQYATLELQIQRLDIARADREQLCQKLRAYARGFAYLADAIEGMS